MKRNRREYNQIFDTWRLNFLIFIPIYGFIYFIANLLVSLYKRVSIRVSSLVLEKRHRRAASFGNHSCDRRNFLSTYRSVIDVVVIIQFTEHAGVTILHDVTLSRDVK